jgi:hypothetical protein
VVTKAKLGAEDEETRGERSIARVNEPREEIIRLYIDRERLRLEYHLDNAIEDGEGEVDDDNP